MKTHRLDPIDLAVVLCAAIFGCNDNSGSEHADGSVAAPLVCQGAVTLDCNSGLVTATTAIPSRVTDWACSTDHFDRDNALFTFSTGTTQRMAVTLETIETGTADYNLFAVRSGACNGTGDCADSSTNGEGHEVVSFAADASDTFLVGYVRSDPGTGPTSLALGVTCEPLVCGDGIITDPEEQCDDGNAASNDGCSSTCSTEFDFQCSGAPSMCKLLCGDGHLDPGEQCEDGGATNGDGCSSVCLIEEGFDCTSTPPSMCHRVVCGNGVVEAGETCDDGTPSMGCDGSCHAKSFTATPAPGGTTTLHGTIDASSPTYSRPDTCNGGTTDTYPYQMFVIENTTAAVETLTITAAWGGDGFLVVYGPPFLPAMPTAHCLFTNDDYMGQRGSRVAGVPISPGRQLIVVATTFHMMTTTGDFTLTIQAN